ncbi:GNAT family N-acetyltransferase [Nocardioides korecus]
MGGARGDATEVRDATAADLDDVVRLEAACLGRDAWSAGLVEAGLRAELPTVGYLVAEAGGAVVGHAVTSLAGDVAELQRIAVAEEARRHGVASALLAAVLSRAVAAGAERVLLEVREDNAGAIAFYARSGFVELARRRRYYADGATALVLQVVLRVDLPGPTGGTMTP